MQQMVVVDKVELTHLLSRIETLEAIVLQDKEDTIFQDKVQALSKGGMIDTNAICTLMGWSRRTFSRRLNQGILPVIQDGRKYKMRVDDFLKWHRENYQG